MFQEFKHVVIKTLCKRMQIDLNATPLAYMSASKGCKAPGTKQEIIGGYFEVQIKARNDNGFIIHFGNGTDIFAFMVAIDVVRVVHNVGQYEASSLSFTTGIQPLRAEGQITKAQLPNGWIRELYEEINEIAGSLK